MGKGSKSYSAAKGSYIQNRMNEGRSNSQARREWNSKHDLDYLAGNYTAPISGENVDRSQDSPMQDYAQTSDDL